jgi:hypothetical protein
VLLGNLGHVSKRVRAAGQVSQVTVSAYGNEDLGNLNVDDHDLGGRTGISGRHSLLMLKLGIIYEFSSRCCLTYEALNSWKLRHNFLSQSRGCTRRLEIRSGMILSWEENETGNRKDVSYGIS